MTLLALTVSIVAAVQAVAAHKKLRAMAGIVDQVIGNTRQLDTIARIVDQVAGHTRQLDTMARIVDQVTGNTRQLDVMASDVRALKTAVAGKPDSRQLDVLTEDIRTIKLALPAEIARQSEIATDALRDVREALNDLSERHNALRHDFDTMAASRAQNADIREFRVRLDLTENAARQAQARVSEIAEQLERVEEYQDRH